MSSVERMSPRELRSSVSLASIFALRMLGLFLILPVFAVHARGLPGADPALIGLALGIYGLTQGVLQIPFGVVSDRIGRKPVIIVGLLIMACGSFIAAAADTLEWIVVGRALQGAGAISAAVTAFIADSTSETNRSKAMALVGGSISAMFAISLVAAPPLYAAIGMSGLFALTGGLTLAAVAIVIWAVPPAPAHAHMATAYARTPWPQVVFNAQLLRLNFGIFVLHAALMAMFVVVPVLLVERGLPLADHAWVYLPVIVGSFALMMGPIRAGERARKLRWVMRGSIALLFVATGGFALGAQDTRFAVLWLAACLFVFFVAFNILEAIVPSLTSRFAPADSRGLALGVYNSCHSIAFYIGGAAGGWLAATYGAAAVFGAVSVAAAAWLLVTRGMREPPAGAAQTPN
jgi:MFS family permease